MTEKAPEQMVVYEKSQRQQSERVILLGPDKCQSSKHSFELGNLPGDSSNEDRLQVRGGDKDTEISQGKAATTALNALQQLS